MRTSGVRDGRWRLAVLVLSGLMALGTAARAREIVGVQPYSLDQPRVPAMLSPAGNAAPLSYPSALTGQRVFAFDWYLDTAASRIALSRTARDTLGVKATQGTVKDWGIAGTEIFDVSAPYVLHVGDTGADPSDPRQFPFALQCVMELRQSDQSALKALPKNLASDLTQTAQAAGLSAEDLGQLLTPPINIVGTPFLQEHTVVLDPRPVAAAMDLVTGLLRGAAGQGGKGGDGGQGGQGLAGTLDQLINALAAGGGTSLGQMGVHIVAPGQTYAPPQIAVPLVMEQMTHKPLPVSDAPVPFVAGVTLENGDKRVTARLALDTGGAVSIISTKLARELGLDLDHPEMKAPLMGVGQGTPEVKGYWLTSMTIPTESGEPLVYRRVPYFVADVEGIDGTVGANLFIPSIDINLSTDLLEKDPMGVLSTIQRGATPFSRIVLDLPNKRLGLDPMPAPPPAPAEQPAPPAGDGGSAR